ncbi:unnamed protein product [Paramecium sonneborni]|uniref:Uncharacterized protein n=1 Tax=Paramecium sonneborni TaxID=65129 RepID=A0A8S1RP22_9CILI|nr:unnamed protein product [Paramecium sonneborni]
MEIQIKNKLLKKTSKCLKIKKIIIERVKGKYFIRGIIEQKEKFINKELKTEFQFVLDQIQQNKIGNIKKLDQSKIYIVQQTLENELINEINSLMKIQQKYIQNINLDSQHFLKLKIE